MAISKPLWLRRWLDELNWDVLTWRIYVGDAIEAAIDWALTWINQAISWGELAYNFARIAWDKAVEVYEDLLALVTSEVDKLWARVNTLWDDIGEWWSARKDEILGWIEAVISGLDDLRTAWDNFWTATWPELVGDLQQLRTNWDNFWTVTFPTLVDVSWLTEWWTGKAAEVGEMIGTAIKETEPFWQGWSDFRESVSDFFADPMEWLLARFTDWFLGPEE